MDKRTRDVVSFLIGLITALIMLQSISHIVAEAQSLETEIAAIEGEGLYLLLSVANAVLSSGYLFAVGVDLGIVVLFLVYPLFPDNGYLKWSLFGMVGISMYSNIDYSIRGELQYGVIEWSLSGVWRAVKIFLFSVPLSALPIALVEIRKLVMALPDIDESKGKAVKPDSKGRSTTPPKTPVPTMPTFIPQRAGTLLDNDPLSRSPVLDRQPHTDPYRRGGQSFTPLPMTPTPTEPTELSKGGSSTLLDVEEVDDEEEESEDDGTVKLTSADLEGMNLTDKERRAVDLRLRGQPLERIGQAMGGSTKQAVSGLLSSAKLKNPTLVEMLEKANPHGTPARR